MAWSWGRLGPPFQPVFTWLMSLLRGLSQISGVVTAAVPVPTMPRHDAREGSVRGPPTPVPQRGTPVARTSVSLLCSALLCCMWAAGIPRAGAGSVSANKDFVYLIQVQVRLERGRGSEGARERGSEGAREREKERKRERERERKRKRERERKSTRVFAAVLHPVSARAHAQAHADPASQGVHLRSRARARAAAPKCAGS